MYDLFIFIFQNSFLLRGCVLFIFGIIIGSFLNVVIYRLPIMLMRKWKKESMNILDKKFVDNKSIELFNLFYPSSHCPKCECKIPFWSNLPILGYIIIAGKCRHCKEKISLRYPLIELFTGLLFVLSGYLSTNLLVLSANLIFISIMLVIIFIDYDNLILPDELTLLLLWLGLLFNLKGDIAGSLVNSVIGAAVGYLSLWLVYWSFKFMTKKDGMGYGDFKLLAAILAFGGYAWISPILLISSILGIVYFIVGRIINKFSYNEQIPFGSFLGIAGIIMMLQNNYFYILFSRL